MTEIGETKARAGIPEKLESIILSLIVTTKENQELKAYVRSQVSEQ